MALEEADRILLRSLADVGFEADEAGSLADLSPGQVFAAVALCVRHVRPELAERVASRMPASLSARLNMCTVMADCCRELGFRGDIGYQTVLYGSTKEVRGVIAFLVDKFPKQDLLVVEPSADPNSALLRATQAALSDALQQPWTPHYCRTTGQRVPFAAERLDVEAGSFVTLQPSSGAAVAPSVLDWTARLLVAGDRPARTGSRPPLPPEALEMITEAERQFPRLEPQSVAAPVAAADVVVSADVAVQESASADSVMEEPPVEQESEQDRREQARLQQEQELAAANESLERIRASLEASTKEYQLLLQECTERQAEAAAEAALLSERRAGLPLRQRARQALDAGGDAVSGATAAERARQRAAHRHAEWETRRADLERTLAELRRTARDAPLEELARRQEELRSELAQRERALATLQGQAAGLKKHVKRTAYTKRILEIVGSVRKQRETITASIEETKALRKSINTTSEKIARTFQAAEEQIFPEAAGNEWSRASYRGLVSLHDCCSELVNLVEQTAAVLRRGRRVQEMIDQERSRRVEVTLEQVRADLEKVRLENQQLQRDV
ncbi:coiled-coil domain-containing protein 22-like [Amphibalanus amphitrite]|uniref:coiled-coil domain-containing protein 22-like n=1 Tax=Amphibalanus amphitrite TaxID=1232801 RepID=UPI001C8FE65B|nr:coiled-coil domain-containing protein 22-like [Amphibalanus amphitrite]